MHAVSYLLNARDLVSCKGFVFARQCTTHTVFVWKKQSWMVPIVCVFMAN
jgi:hypothetical protein